MVFQSRHMVEGLDVGCRHGHFEDHRQDRGAAIMLVPKEGNEEIFSRVMTDKEFRSAAHEHFADDPGSQANNVKALVGVDAVRLRVGDWRVIMHDGVVLDVLNIAARGSVY